MDCEQGQEKEQWYVLYVPGGKEEQIKTVLESKFGDRLCFRVLKRVLRERKDGVWHRVERKLFPGYVIVSGMMDVGLYGEMVDYYKGFRFLKSDEEFHTIGEHELRVLGLLVNEEDGLIEMSKLYKENDVIRVVEGPLVGREGLIVKVNARKGRAKVMLDFDGVRREVELGVEVISS